MNRYLGSRYFTSYITTSKLSVKKKKDLFKQKQKRKME